MCHVPVHPSGSYSSGLDGFEAISKWMFGFSGMEWNGTAALIFTVVGEIVCIYSTFCGVTVANYSINVYMQIYYYEDLKLMSNIMNHVEQQVRLIL